jgi:GNAT superfamily N-acetyltransferase
MLTLRPATSFDVDVLYELICELALFEKKKLSDLPLSKENLLRYGFSEPPRFYVELAENKNGPVGYALYSYGFSAHQGKPFLYIDDLYIRDRERGKGFGTALLTKLAGYAKEQNCCFMQWHTFSWNEKALAFYTKIGACPRQDLVLIRMQA